MFVNENFNSYKLGSKETCCIFEYRNKQSKLIIMTINITQKENGSLRVTVNKLYLSLDEKITVSRKVYETYPTTLNWAGYVEENGNTVIVFA